MTFSLRNFWQRERKIFPTSVTLIIAAMAFEYAAWGFIDPFYSVLAEGIFQNYLLVGAAYGTIQASVLISLFFVSELLRIIPPISIALFGKGIMLLTFLGYFMAAFFQIPWLFFVLALFHGTGMACREVSSREILIEHCTHKNASTLLGWNAGFRDGSWALTMIFSGILLVFISEILNITPFELLPGVFLWGIPLLILGFFLLLRAKKHLKKPLSESHPHRFSIRHCADFFQALPKMTSAMKFSIAMLFFLQLIQSTTALLLPLLALSLELSVDEIGLLMGLVCIPLLFSSFFSVFEDNGDRMLFILGGLLFVMIPLFLLAQTSTPVWIGVLSMLVSLSIAVIRPASLGLIAANIDHRDAPAIASLQVFFNRSGATLGAFGMGFVAQNFGIQNAFFIVGILAVFFAIIAVFVRAHYFPRIPKPHFFKIHPLHLRIFSHHL